MVSFTLCYACGGTVSSFVELFTDVSLDIEVVSFRLAGRGAGKPWQTSFNGRRRVGMVVQLSNSSTLFFGKMASTNWLQNPVSSTAGAAKVLQTTNSLRVKWRPGHVDNRTVTTISSERLLAPQMFGKGPLETYCRKNVPKESAGMKFGSAPVSMTERIRCNEKGVRPVSVYVLDVHLANLKIRSVCLGLPNFCYDPHIFRLSIAVRFSRVSIIAVVEETPVWNGVSLVSEEKVCKDNSIVKPFGVSLPDCGLK